jgi:glucose/arabinose dehydrogenase
MKASDFFIVIAMLLAGGHIYSQAASDGLPEPYATKAVTNRSQVIGWPTGKTPTAPEGFVVSRFADGMKSPRWIYVLPDSDVLVSCANTGYNSANTVLLFRGIDKNGKPTLRDTFLSDLNQPFGMLLLGDKFYVANTDGIMVYPYQKGQTKITTTGKKILSLPAGGYNNHWTRNLIAKPDGTKIYVTVGSGSNVAEHGIAHEDHRANIIEINPDGTGERIYASGLRNPVGMDWTPGTNTLWTAVNERDNLGDELVPDYMTSVRDGGFYGWPYSYFGQHIDPRISARDQRPDLIKKAIVPDVSLGSHTASLGLVFYTQTAFPAKYHGGVFIGQHGSWNRSVLTGYRVAFVPFENGKPSGEPEDFLTGFIADVSRSEVYGRPVGVTVLPDGSLLVTDDSSGILWRVSAKK